MIFCYLVPQLVISFLTPDWLNDWHNEIFSFSFREVWYEGNRVRNHFLFMTDISYFGSLWDAPLFFSESRWAEVAVYIWSRSSQLMIREVKRREDSFSSDELWDDDSVFLSSCCRRGQGESPGMRIANFCMSIWYPWFSPNRLEMLVSVHHVMYSSLILPVVFPLLIISCWMIYSVAPLPPFRLLNATVSHHHLMILIICHKLLLNVSWCSSSTDIMGDGTL